MYPSALKVRIVTPTLAQSRDFYIDCLGMRLMEEWREPGDAGCILVLANGGVGAFLELAEGPEEQELSGLSLQFETKDLAKFRSLLPEGVEAGGLVERPWGSTYLSLKDPNDISVIVFERGQD